MPSHWIGFFIGWAICLAAFLIYPSAPWITDPVHRMAAAVGATLPPMLVVLVGAGIGRLAKRRTATGMKIGGVLAGLYMIGYLVSVVS
ncbi:hypothetical protein [uncultured Halomonas sp.]|uniref:hypothetical protein n=1 Tax=uncultured Halomonas sp. TaxID=173971 RepID=UPI0026153B90|nr:hypothetical protein [uncultured Halomonas sp.]